LVVGTFALLKETPVWEIGINHAAHVPKQRRRWDDVVAQFGDPQRSLVLLDEQRLQTIELVAPRDDDFVGDRKVSLQPSVLLDEGVWYTINDHVIVHAPTEQESMGAQDAMSALEGIWDDSRRVADHIHGRVAA
jgi:hypothetical protein